MQTIVQDLKFGLRQLRRSPGLAMAAVLTLALGIGANTAIFSLVDQALLRSLPVRDPQQLAVLKGTGEAWQGHTSSHGSIGAEASFSYPMYRDLRDHDAAFQGLIATAPADVALVAKGNSRSISGEIVSGNYFSVLGVTPVLGQLFTQAEDLQTDAAPVTVLSYDFWRNGMNSDPGVVGSTVSFNGHPFQVVGVARPGFRSAVWGESPAFFVPMAMLDEVVPGAARRLTDHTDRWVNILGRLQERETSAQAEAASAPLWHALRAEELKALGKRSPRFVDSFLNRSKLLVEPAARGIAYNRDMYETPLLVMMGMAGLVLLIAVVNIGSLLMVRAAGRGQEFSMRRALGASGVRLTAQLLTEGLLIGIAGGALALLLAPLVSRMVAAQLTGFASGGPFDTKLDAHLLLFNFVVTVSFSVLFSLVPWLQLRRRNLMLAQKQGSPTASSGLLLLRRSVVGVQIGLGMLLLVSAGLFIKTLQRLSTQDVGFRTDHLVVFGLSPRQAGYAPERVPQLETQLVGALGAVPGVASTSITNNPELVGNNRGGDIAMEHYVPGPEEEVHPEKANITPMYFSTMKVPVLAGRPFAEGDDTGHSLAVIVNRSLAVRYFGSVQKAVGQRLKENGGRDGVFDTEIVGVVGDVRHLSMRSEPEPALFRPVAQASQSDLRRTLYVYVRSHLPPETMYGSVTAAVARVDPSLTVDGWETMDGEIQINLEGERSTAMLATAFGALAAVLAGVGLYGVLAFAVAQRTREIGVRMALGATRRDVSGMVLSDVGKMMAGGVLVGLPLTLLLGRAVHSQLYGVTPADPVSLVAAVVLLATIALVAAAVPARRAVSVNPTEALRTE